MTGDQALAQRLMACPRWRWMPGMRDIVNEARVTDANAYTIEIATDGNDQFRWSRREIAGRWTRRRYDPSYGYDCPDDSQFDGIPDLDDPATLGCVLSIVREAWADPGEEWRRAWGGPWAVATMPEMWSGAAIVGWRVSIVVRGPDHVLVARGATEAEALVVALEVAP